MWSTILTTSPCSGSEVFSTYLSVKNQIAACTAAALSLRFGQRGRLVSVGVVLVEQPRHVVHVGDVRGVPGAQYVPDSAVRRGQDVDAVEAELGAAVGRLAMDDAGETLVQGAEAPSGSDCSRDSRPDRVKRVEASAMNPLTPWP